MAEIPLPVDVLRVVASVTVRETPLPNIARATGQMSSAELARFLSERPSGDKGGTAGVM